MFHRLLLASFVCASYGYKSELILQDDQLVGAVVRSKPPSPSDFNLPDSYDLRSSGLLTSNLNQHIPIYCG